SIEIENKNVGILIIYSAVSFPVRFEKTDYIRIGSYTKRLKDYPAVESQLWDKIKNIRFETQWAKADLELSKALNMLDYGVYFDLTNTSMPSDTEGIAHYLSEEKIIVRQDNGLYAITNFGAILFAKRFSEFDKISRKAIRVVQYEGNNRLVMLKENTENKGYAIAFEGLMKYIDALIPTQELIVDALREKKSAYPMLAIREAVANALIHQDFSITGTGPVVEIFSNRIEITNAGTPLIDVYRIIDNPPKSRNEKLAELMRRLRICEELGTGWDKIVLACEILQLPAPRIDLYETNTKVTLFAEIPYSSLSAEEKLWACYLHACIKQVQGEQLTNSSLRIRFGLKDSSAGSISRLIKEAVEEKLIKPLDPETAPRYMKYIPVWA
ncbi:MAG: ATP-binding protein, partial [Lachnospiraceae bacterium]